jgi:peptidoglycan/LPS O-acetylase OafA/YrhL
VRGAFRPDIEGMRGVAVLLVVLFHAWPGLVSGGFIGVDVFFVISGFLITGLLYRELGRTGRIVFSAFYVRRIRRLLPAAALAIGGTFLLSAWLLSPLALPRVTLDGVAAALSVSNIRFALTSDYFTAVATPSPFLHYWSLSVEEQFYLVWPALLFLLHRLGGARLLVIGIVAIAAGSLWLAVAMTEVDAAWAFFSLFTRAWQLALGGLLAIIALERFRTTAVSGALAVVGWGGLAAVLVAGLLFDDQLAYPGAWAVLPTLGAVALIAGGDRRLGPGLILRTPPLRFLGRISYALYLWHWPLLVLPAVAYGEALPPAATIALVAVAVAISTLSTILVEEPIRRGTARGQGRRALRLAAPPVLALALAVVVGVGASRWVTEGAMAESRGDETAAAGTDGLPPPQDIEGEVVLESFDERRPRPRQAESTPGPRTPVPEVDATPAPRRTPALDPDATPKPRRTPSPTPAPAVEQDPAPRKTPRPERTPRPTPVVRLPEDVRPTVWKAPDDHELLRDNGCLQAESVTTPRSCIFGRRGSRFTVALVGDSHASHWFPAVQRVAEQRRWRLETYVKVSCPFSDVLVRNLEKKKRYTECLAFNQATVRTLKATRPDLVITALSRWQHPVDDAYAGATAQGDGIARLLRQVPGTKVVIADVPYPGHDVPECLAGHIRDVRKCAVPSYHRVSGGSPARERRAARVAGGVVLNFNDLICGGEGACPVVRNDMIVYRDHHHLTATFARSLGPALDRALQTVLERDRKRGDG